MMSPSVIHHSFHLDLQCTSHMPGHFPSIQTEDLRDLSLPSTKRYRNPPIPSSMKQLAISHRALVSILKFQPVAFQLASLPRSGQCPYRQPVFLQTPFAKTHRHAISIKGFDPLGPAPPLVQLFSQVPISLIRSIIQRRHLVPVYFLDRYQFWVLEEDGRCFSIDPLDEPSIAVWTNTGPCPDSFHSDSTTFSACFRVSSRFFLFAA